MHRRTLLAGAAGALGRLALPGGIAAMAGCSAPADLADTRGFGGATMGTTYSVRSAAGVDPERLAALAAEVHELLSGIDARMSTYDPDGELARFNRARDTDWQHLSADTTAVLARALEASRDSGGAFDATVGPLVNLWGFGPDGAVSRAPETRAVAAGLERVGWRHVELDGARGAVRKTRPDTFVDLCGIAKGFGVDAVAALLDARGLTDYLVEVGGELRTRGRRPGGAPWRVGIEQPLAGTRRMRCMVDLRGRAIATSGDYRNYFDEAGRHYSHAIDPRSGRPVEHALASVTVIADATMDADATSTALMVMGPETGPDWARERGIAALFLLRDGASLAERMTPAFAEHRVG